MSSQRVAVGNKTKYVFRSSWFTKFFPYVSSFPQPLTSTSLDRQKQHGYLWSTDKCELGHRPRSSTASPTWLCWVHIQICSVPEYVWQWFVWTIFHLNSNHSPSNSNHLVSVCVRAHTHTQSAINRVFDSCSGSKIPGKVKSFPLIFPLSLPPNSQRAM